MNTEGIEAHPGGSAWWEEIDYLHYPKAIIQKESPDIILKEFIKDEKWFEGIVLSISHYEILALEQIYKHLEENDKRIDNDKFKNIGFERTLDLLYILGIIDHSDYSQMNKLRIYRNDVVHKFKKINPREARKLIEHGIKCWDRLRKARL